MRRIVALVLVVPALAAAQPRAEPDAAWDDAFTLTSGWNGGDIGHSIDLGDGRTLWLLGDSIVGPVRDGSRVGGESKMVRGAIAWHETPEAGEAPGEMHFAIPEDGHGVAVAGWTCPAEGLWPDGTWYWLMGDGAAVVDADGVRRFVLFATAIGPAGNPEGMWDFRRVGGTIMTVENPGDAPDAWRVEQRVNPLVTETAKFGEPAREGENWGLAVVAWPPGVAVGSRTLYVYGLRSRGPGDNRLLVARCGEAELDAPGSWLFWDGEVWSDRAADAAPIAKGLVDEFTIEPVRRGGADELVLIQSEPMLGRHILARVAAEPEGPWSAPTPVFEVPGMDSQLLTYAAKGHASLSGPGEILISYAVNSSDFGRVFRESSLYRPRFVVAPLEMLPSARQEPGR